VIELGQNEFIIIKFMGRLGPTVGFPVPYFLFYDYLTPLFSVLRLFNSQFAGTPIVCTHSRLYSSFISQFFHIEILNTDLQTFGAKVFADSHGKSLETLEVITIHSFKIHSFVFNLSQSDSYTENA